MVRETLSILNQNFVLLIKALIILYLGGGKRHIS